MLLSRDTRSTQCCCTATQEEILCEITALSYWLVFHASYTPDLYSSFVQYSVLWHPQHPGPTSTNAKVTLPIAPIWEHMPTETLGPSRASMPKEQKV